MEFYQISQMRNGQYELIEEDDTQAKAVLSQRQLGIIADRLSALYWQQETLPLRIRTYLTAYYSQGQTEYISLQSTPSLLLSEKRLVYKYGQSTVLDGFALTFLEGEEENRVWLGEDGLVENRGSSTEKVQRLLKILVDSLNQPPEQHQFLTKTACPKEDFQHLLSNRQWLEAAQAQGWLDRNQEEIIWYETVSADKKESHLWSEAVNNGWTPEYYLSLLAPNAYYELIWRDGEMTLWQNCYPWEQPSWPEKLWDWLVKITHGKEQGL